MPTNFTIKVNRRPVGADQLIIGEPHLVPTVPPYVARLIEVPLISLPVKDVTIPGFVRVGSGSPGPGQFYVDSITGRMTFHISAAGSSVPTTYYGLGSQVDAEDVNWVQDAINALELEIESARGSQPNLNTRISYALEGTGDIKDNFIKPNHISNVSTDDFVFPGDVTINGTLIMPNNEPIGIGNFTTAQETVLIAGLGPGDAGKMWFNGSTRQFMGWTGSSAVILG